MKRFLLLPLICAMLLALCSGQTAQAAGVSLADGMSPAEFAQFANEIFEDPRLVSAPTYNERASEAAGSTVFSARTKNGAAAFFHMNGDDLSYLKIRFDEDNEAQMDDMSGLSIAAYYAAGMEDDEITWLQKKGKSRLSSNTFTYRGYCASAERTIIKRLVFNGTDSFATVYAVSD